jgi:hypothetical protein
MVVRLESLPIHAYCCIVSLLWHFLETCTKVIETCNLFQVARRLVYLLAPIDLLATPKSKTWGNWIVHARAECIPGSLTHACSMLLVPLFVAKCNLLPNV